MVSFRDEPFYEKVIILMTFDLFPHTSAINNLFPMIRFHRHHQDA
jgi:hypothetical protein